MNISKNDIKIIVLYSIAAYVAGSVLGTIYVSQVGYNLNLGLFSLIFEIFYVFIYGFCGFEAVDSLKGKTRLSWIKITLLMIVTLWIISVARIVSEALLGEPLHGSGNILGYIATILGGYVAHKRFIKK